MISITLFLIGIVYAFVIIRYRSLNVIRWFVIMPLVVAMVASIILGLISMAERLTATRHLSNHDRNLDIGKIGGHSATFWIHSYYNS